MGQIILPRSFWNRKMFAHWHKQVLSAEEMRVENITKTIDGEVCLLTKIHRTY